MSSSSAALSGVWAALPIPWQGDGRIDAGLVAELVARYRAAGVDGVYTTGTDGEWHVLDEPEYRALIDAFAPAVAAAGMPAQAGATWHHLDGVIARGRHAAERGIGIIQVALPSWVPLNDTELADFFGGVQGALPETGVVHYNIARAGRFLTGQEYRAIREVAPNLIGSKQTGGDVAALIEIVGATPEMDHFVVDTQIVPGALFGARGFYSFLVNLNPRFSVDLWRDCQRGDWAEAARKRVLVDAFFREWLRSVPEITASPALAKIATRAGIMSEMPLAVRAPYREGTARHVEALRAMLRERFPALVYEA